MKRFLKREKPPGLNGQAQSDSDDAENDFDMDKNENDESSDDEVEYDGSEFPIVRKVEIRWKALKHGLPGTVSKHMLLTMYEERKMHKNELGYFVSGYDINVGSNPPTQHFHLGDCSDSDMHAAIELMERRNDDPAPQSLYNEMIEKFKYVYKSSEDDFETTDSEEYRYSDSEEESEDDTEEQSFEESKKISSNRDKRRTGKHTERGKIECNFFRRSRQRNVTKGPKNRHRPEQYSISRKRYTE